METKYGFFARVRDSIMGPARIATYAIENVKAKSVSFLALLSLIGVVLSIASTLTLLYPMGGIQRVTDQLPQFTLKNGRLDLYIDEPVIIDTEYNAIIIEQGESTGIVDRYLGYGQVVYINSAGFLVKDNGEVNSLNWSDFGDLNFNTQEIVDTVFKWTWVVLLIATPFVFLFVWAGDLLFTLVASLLGLIVNLIFGTKVPYGKVFKLSVYAMTTQKLLGIILSIVSSFVPLFSFKLPTLVNFLITVGFLVLYFHTYKKSKQENQQLPA